MSVGPKICGVSELHRGSLCVDTGKSQSNFIDSFAYFSDQAEKYGVAQQCFMKKEFQTLGALRNYSSSIKKVAELENGKTEMFDFKEVELIGKETDL